MLTTRDATYVFLVRDGKVHAHRAAVTAAALDKSVRELRQGLDLADGQAARLRRCGGAPSLR